MKKYTYLFNEGNINMIDKLGNKGANLCEMTKMGLPIPNGFIISTEVCNLYTNNNKVLFDDIKKQIIKSINKIEIQTNKKFGNKSNPLLFSVRSGAKVSMPGMMETILNLGLNDETVLGLAKKTNNIKFAYDCYRRFIQMYSEVVKKIDKNIFEKVLIDQKNKRKIKYDYELNENDLLDIIKEYKKIYLLETNEEFPMDPYEQLYSSINAVFDSFNTPRAITFRKLNKISNDVKTAVNVQMMVFGNSGKTSATGVVFSRNPSNGKNVLYGEYLLNAQGEDIVSGIRTPEPIYKLKKKFPKIYNELLKISKKLENHFLDMQDIEFTIDNNKLYILQTRNGKRTAQATIKILYDLNKENKISRREVINRLNIDIVNQLLHKEFDLKELKILKLLTTGVSSSIGCATGKIVFSSIDAKKSNEDVILIRNETSADDIEGMIYSKGIITSKGGVTSHAAVVARGMGKPCITGCENIIVDEKNKTLKINNVILKEGDYISINGSTGNIYQGKAKLVDSNIIPEFKHIINWAKKIKKIGVRANADTPSDVKKSFDLGAEGIGLVRTEHMFFEEKRILKMRKMILSNNIYDRQKALNELQKYQENDFYEMYKVAKTNPMIIRLLDPPLHEFLPKTDIELYNLSNYMNISEKQIINKIEKLKEVNPMMGHRGCRLLISYPEIIRMQVNAIIKSAIKVSQEQKIKIIPQIMVPLISDTNEFTYIKNIIDTEVNNIQNKNNYKIKYKVGSMIEVPRIALNCDKLSLESDFFSFGTNDLTQMTFGFSRDDSSKFLNDYYKNEIFRFNPFEEIDQSGVGELINISINKARKIVPKINFGVCGEHAGNTKSIKFFIKSKINYVSCSPLLVPIAIIAAAKEELLND